MPCSRICALGRVYRRSCGCWKGIVFVLCVGLNGVCSFCEVRSVLFFFFSSRRRHTRSLCDWSSDVCSSDLKPSVMPSVEGLPTTHSEPSSKRRSFSSAKLPWRGKPLQVEWLRRRRSRVHSRRSEERRVGKECRSRWSPYH